MSSYEGRLATFTSWRHAPPTPQPKDLAAAGFTYGYLDTVRCTAKATCGKSSCKHCEEVFDSKNKLHDHVRNKECQQSPTKSKLANKTGLMPLSTSETIFNDADTAIKKGGIKPNTRPAATSSSAAKSIAPHKSSVSALTHVENTPPKISATPPTTPPPIYRAVSPPPPTYQTITPKTYLTIADLYMRYAPIKSAHSRPTTTRTMSVLPTMSIQDLYKQFGKEKSIISTPNKTLDSSTNRNATSDYYTINYYKIEYSDIYDAIIKPYETFQA
ncbi:MAG: hypothetical protein ASARMPRED_006752 [Alectoria sarmentosa]|nr:MAG: hypothetical protein ASARMPRED_006752 [Alectoria sarmentosa]